MSKSTIPLNKWYRRHVVISHPDRKIYIQIMWDGDGEINYQEFADVKKGAWFGLVPPEVIPELRQAIASGYQVQPIALMGNPAGEQHLVLQIIELTDSHHIITDAGANILKPVHDA